MRYKKIMLLAIFLVSLLAVSAVSATENATSDVVGAEETSDNALSTQTTDEVVSVPTLDRNNNLISEKPIFNNNSSNFYIESNDLFLYYDNLTNFNVRIFDNNGTPIGSNEPVNFCINGSNYTNLTNDEGYASISINQIIGKYTIITTYKDAFAYNELIIMNTTDSRIKSEIHVSSLTTKYNKGDYIIVTLKGNDGNCISNEELDILIYNLNSKNIFKSFILNTDEKGQLKIPTRGIPIGNYNISINYWGNGEYQSANASSSLNVSENYDNYVGTFADLVKEAKGQNGKIVLNRDYKCEDLYDQEYKEYPIKMWSSSYIIDGNGHSIEGDCYVHLIQIGGRNVTVKNLTILNCQEGIYGLGLSDTLVINCTFINTKPDLNSRRKTTGIGATHSIKIENCTFINMTNCGVMIHESSVVSNCKFINNTGSTGGGISCTGSNTIISNCIFINNTATSINGNGGGAIMIWNDASRCKVNNCIFINNTAYNQGDAIFWRGNYGNINNCYFAPEDSSIYLYGNNINIEKAILSIALNNYSYVYDGPINSLVSVTHNNFPVSNKKILFEISNGDKIYTNYVTTDENGVANISNIISKLECGDWQVNVYFEGDNYYYSYKTLFKISIKHLTSLNLLNITGAVNQESTFIAYVNSNNLNINEGNIAFYINNDYLGSVPVVNGSASFTYVPLNVGEYNIKAIFSNSDNFFNDESIAMFNVDPLNSSLSFGRFNSLDICDIYITVDYDYIEFFTKISSTETVNEGVVTFFDGETKIGESLVSNGVATLIYTPTTVGEHIITAIFNSSNYLSSNDTVKVLIDSATFEVSANSGTVGYNSTFVAEFKCLYRIENKGIVTFYIDDECLGNVSVVNGSASISYLPLNVNNYTVKATFEGSDYFDNRENSTFYTVVPSDSIIMVGDMNGTVGSDITITVNVTSFNNLTINEGHVIFFDGETQIGMSQLNNGVAVLTYTPTTVGEHPIIARYYGTNYEDSVNSALLNVSKADIVLNIEDIAEADFKKPSKFTVHVTSNSKEVNEGQIKFYVNGSFIGCSNISNGTANLEYISNNGGFLILTTVYEETDNYLTSSNSTNFMVNAIPSSLIVSDITAYYNDNTYLLIQLVDSIGNPISNEKVLVYFDDVKTFITDNKGQIKVSLNDLTPKSYTTKVTFEGNANYTQTTTFVDVVVHKAPSYIVMDDFKSAVGEELIITVNIVNYSNNLTINDGRVIFFDGATNIGESYVVNGSASLTYIPLYAGNHTIKAVYSDSIYFADNEKNTQLAVNKANSKLLMADLNGTVNYEVMINVNIISSNNLTVNEGYVSFYKDDIQIGKSPVRDGVATLTYVPTEACEYVITAMYYGTNYEDSVNSTFIKISKSEVVLNINNIQTVYFTNPSKFAINVLSNSKGINEGTIKYYVNGNYIGMSSVVNGKTSTTYITNATGSFNLLIVFDETENYLAQNSSTTFYIDRMPTVLTGESVIFDEAQSKTFKTVLKDNNDNGVYNQNIKIEAIKYSGESRTFTGISDANGITIYDVDNLAGGMWYVTGIYGGNDNYVESTFADKFIIVRMDTTTTIEEITNPLVNHTYKFKANIYDENGKLVKEGIVQFYLDGVDIGLIDLSNSNGYQNALSNGVLGVINPIFAYELGADEEASDLYIEYIPTKAGKHTLTAVYEGTTIYKASNQTTTFIVSEESNVEPEIIIPPLDEPSTDGSVTISLPSDATGTVILNINGQNYTFDVKNGVANVTLPELTDGNYDYTITYSGDSKYSSFATNGSFNVNNTQTNTTGSNVTDDNSTGGNVSGNITVEPEIIIPPLDEPSDDGSVTITLPSDATGKITLSINGKDYNYLVENGVATVILPNLRDGNYEYTITYSGDNKYSSFNSSGSLKVNNTAIKPVENTTDTNNTDNTTGGNASDIKPAPEIVIPPLDEPSADGSVAINLPNDATGTVTLTVDGKNYTFDVKNGVADVKLPELGDGNYNYTITYSGDSKYSSFSTKGNMKVNNTKPEDTKSTPEIVIPPLDEPSEDGSVTIILPGDATGKVTLSINGKSYNYLVENGVANVIIPNLGEGNYPYTITYSGDSKYSSFTTNGSLNKSAPKVDPRITAKNTAVQYFAKGKYSVTVYGTDGKVASGVQVIFKISGKQVAKAKTNAKGVASYVVTKNPGKYKIQATALGKSVTKTITVKHIVTLKTVTLKKSAKKLTLQATLAKVNGKYLKKKTITFKINGKKVATAKTNSKGVAKITIKNPSVIKKLKVGKKVTYLATYLKDTVKKTAKIKK